jgi:hypothetical protein
VTTSGGTTTPAQSEITSNTRTAYRFYGNVPVTMGAAGAACMGAPNCQATVEGFFAGPSADRIGIVITLKAGSTQGVQVAAAFAR